MYYARADDNAFFVVGFFFFFLLQNEQIAPLRVLPAFGILYNSSFTRSVLYITTGIIRLITRETILRSSFRLNRDEYYKTTTKIMVFLLENPCPPPF